MLRKLREAEEDYEEQDVDGQIDFSDLADVDAEGNPVGWVKEKATLSEAVRDIKQRASAGGVFDTIQMSFRRGGFVSIGGAELRYVRASGRSIKFSVFTNKRQSCTVDFWVSNLAHLTRPGSDWHSYMFRDAVGNLLTISFSEMM